MTTEDYVKKKRALMAKQTREERKAAGVCMLCNAKVAKPGGTMCSAHNKIRSEKAQARRRALAAAGLCIYCGKKPGHNGRTYCEECKEAMHGREKRFWRRKSNRARLAAMGAGDLNDLISRSALIAMLSELEGSGEAIAVVEAAPAYPLNLEAMPEKN